MSHLVKDIICPIHHNILFLQIKYEFLPLSVVDCGSRNGLTPGKVGHSFLPFPPSAERHAGRGLYGGFMGIGIQEILVVLVVGLVLFGAKRLPEIGSGLGRAIKNFKKAAIEPDEIDITPPRPEKTKAGNRDDT
jgi:sec-independent protein translocase protein TatA